MTHSLIIPILVLNVVNLVFYTSFYWKWPASCHVFVKWSEGRKQLDHAVISHQTTLNEMLLFETISISG